MTPPPPPALPPTRPATSSARHDTVQTTESRYLGEGGGGGHQKQAHASEPLNIYSGPQIPAVKVKQPSGLPPGGGGGAEGDQKTTDLSVVLSASLSLFFPNPPPRVHPFLPPSIQAGGGVRRQNFYHQYIFLRCVFQDLHIKLSFYSLLL